MIATEEKPVQILELFGGIGSPIPFNGCYIQGRRNVKEKNNEIAQEKAK